MLWKSFKGMRKCNLVWQNSLYLCAGVFEKTEMSFEPVEGVNLEGLH